MSLWAIGRQDLKLSNLEFWELTPRMLNALLKRRRQLSLQKLWPYGVLATLLANQWRAKDAKLAEAWDFFPELKSMLADAPEVDSPAKTPDQLLGIVAALNAALGGTDLRKRNGVATPVG